MVMRTLDIIYSSSCINLYFYINKHFKCGISSTTVENVAWVKQNTFIGTVKSLGPCVISNIENQDETENSCSTNIGFNSDFVIPRHCS